MTNNHEQQLTVQPTRSESPPPPPPPPLPDGNSNNIDNNNNYNDASLENTLSNVTERAMDDSPSKPYTDTTGLLDSLSDKTSNNLLSPEQQQSVQSPLSPQSLPSLRENRTAQEQEEFEMVRELSYEEEPPSSAAATSSSSPNNKKYLSQGGDLSLAMSGESVVKSSISSEGGGGRGENTNNRDSFDISYAPSTTATGDAAARSSNNHHRDSFDVRYTSVGNVIGGNGDNDNDGNDAGSVSNSIANSVGISITASDQGDYHAYDGNTNNSDNRETNNGNANANNTIASEKESEEDASIHSNYVTSSAHLQAHLALEAIRQHHLQQEMANQEKNSLYNNLSGGGGSGVGLDNDEEQQQLGTEVGYYQDDISSLQNGSYQNSQHTPRSKQYQHQQQQHAISPQSQATSINNNSPDPFASSRQYLEQTMQKEEESYIHYTDADGKRLHYGGEDGDIMDMEMYQLQKQQRKRNILIVVMLLTFLAIVSAIGAGVGVAVKKNGEVSGVNDGISGGGEGGSSGTGSAADDASAEDGVASDGGVDGENTNNHDSAESGGDTIAVDAEYEQVNEVVTPTTSPTPAPSAPPTTCIPLEVGIIFDEYAGETSWKILRGDHPKNEDANSVRSLNATEDNGGKESFLLQNDDANQEDEDIAWQSKYYNPNSFNSRADTFTNCIAPGTYTFVFQDRESDGICCNHGDGLYLLTSQGKVITIGGEMTTKETRYVFKLPFLEPDPIDANDDGLDDRTGWIMPFDSSKFTKGETCDLFRLELKTDQYGLETTWELFEGADDSSVKVVANGGPYASDSRYVVEYCLPSAREYALYVYDWAREGICCGSGNGSYNVTSGDIIIFESDGVFGEKEVTQFYLPAPDMPSSTPSTFPTKSPFSGTISPTLSPQESCIDNGLCSKAGDTCTAGVQSCCGVDAPMLECSCTGEGFLKCVTNDSCKENLSCCPDSSGVACSTELNENVTDECDAVGGECNAVDDKGKEIKGWCCMDNCLRKYCAV